MDFFTNFEMALTANKEQNPQDVADAVSDLIDTPAGQRSFRTVVDKMGMGDHIKGYNDQLEQITAGIYNAFGIGDMLKIKGVILIFHYIWTTSIYIIGMSRVLMSMSLR